MRYCREWWSPGRTAARVAALALAAVGCLDAPSPDGGRSDADPERADAAELVACEGNLVANASFEDSTAGWGTVLSTMDLVDGGRDGLTSIEVCATADASEYYSVDDDPDTIPEPQTSEQYELTAWIRTDSPAGSQEVEIVLRERALEGNVNGSGFIWPDGEWGRAEATLTVTSAQPDSVDVYFASWNPAVGNCFQVDAICLVRLQ